MPFGGRLRWVKAPLYRMGSRSIHGTGHYRGGRAGAFYSPVNTSNNVEATFDFVEATFDFVAFDNVASTLLLGVDWVLPTYASTHECIVHAAGVQACPVYTQRSNAFTAAWPRERGEVTPQDGNAVFCRTTMDCSNYSIVGLRSTNISIVAGIFTVVPTLWTNHRQYSTVQYCSSTLKLPLASINFSSNVSYL